MPHPNTVFEITSRTVHGRFLLKPSREVNEVILGIIGRAQQLYPTIDIYVFVFLSNHFEILGSAPDFGVISAFIGYVKSNIARELGKIYEWKEKFWGRRFRSIAVLDDTALLGRVRYILEHGCKENLVAKPGDWPGVQCVSALTRGESLIGWWYDRTTAYQAAREGKELPLSEFAQQYEVRLSPLPCWAELPAEEQQARYQAMVEEIEDETRERMKSEGIRPLGVMRILAQDPHRHPESPKRSPAPACHASSRAVREWFRRGYRKFAEAYRRASERFLSGELTVEFPEHCFPPPLPYRRGPAFAPG